MRKVIITGGSRGIGAAAVRKFTANRDMVAFIYRSDDNSAMLLSEQTGAVAVKADVSVPGACEAAVARLGGVDVLVCCAGISQIKLFTDITDGDWEAMLATDLSGAFYACRAAARVMTAQHSGKIVTVGSMWGARGASCEVHYSAAKAGVRGLTTALARELGQSGINVNCVEPGFIDTDMNAALDENTRRGLTDATPLRRAGTPDEVAEAIFWLASDGASFVTGQCLGVDGGIIA